MGDLCQIFHHSVGDCLSCRGPFNSSSPFSTFFCSFATNAIWILMFIMTYFQTFFRKIPPWDLMNKKRNLILLHGNQTKLLITFKHSQWLEVRRNHDCSSILSGKMQILQATFFISEGGWWWMDSNSIKRVLNLKTSFHWKVLESNFIDSSRKALIFF